MERTMPDIGLGYHRASSTFCDSSHTKQNKCANTSLLSSGAATIKCTIAFLGFCYMRTEEQAMSSAGPYSNLLTQGEPFFSSQDTLEAVSYTVLLKWIKARIFQIPYINQHINCCSNNH